MKHNGESPTKFVNFTVFGHGVGVMFTTDVRKSLKEHFGLTANDAQAVCYRYNSKARSVLIFNYDAGVGTVSHECFHAIWNMFKYHRVKLSNEGVAYHLGYLVRSVYALQGAARKSKREYYAKQRNNKHK